MDVIVYISDLRLFREQTKNDGIVTNTPRTPVHYNGGEALCIVRTNEKDMSHFITISSASRLGEVIDGAAAFDSEDDRLTYERVRGPLSETVKVDGKQIEILKPYLIGVIA